LLKSLAFYTSAPTNKEDAETIGLNSLRTKIKRMVDCTKANLDIQKHQYLESYPLFLRLQTQPAPPPINYYPDEFYFEGCNTNNITYLPCDCHWHIINKLNIAWNFKMGNLKQ
jgi:hypothetical protein